MKTFIMGAALQEGTVAEASTPRTRYRWVVLLFAWGALLLTFVDRLAWSNLGLAAATSLGMPIAALGVFVTAFYAGYVLSNVIGGLATDLLGARVVLPLSLVPLGICTALFGSITSLYTGLLLQTLMGLAAGCDYSACIKLTTSWFDLRSRGRALGLLLTATSLAVVLTNGLVPALLHFSSWTGIYRGLGIVTCVFGIACLFVLRDGPLAGRQGERPQKRQRVDVRLLLENRDLMLVALAGLGAMWGTWGFAFWANALMVKGHGLSTSVAGSITVMFGVGAIVSKPCIGFLSDWLGGRRKVLVMICVGAFAGLLLMFGSLHTVSQFRVVAPLLGVTAFAYSPLMAAMITEIAGRSLAGSATGLTNALWQLGSVIVPVAVGAVCQWSHSFLAAFLTLALGPLVAFISMMAVREAPSA
ncbi:MFS transporter [Paraburkholderia sediminicola]|uniref:MFS transporter n=1 Tax=Paraburkholderia sediminicola TaxID=458836 RepID=UPI0038B7347E